MDYYTVQQNLELPNLAYLSKVYDRQGNYILPKMFTSSTKVDIELFGTFLVHQAELGEIYDFAETYLGIPIVSNRVCRIIHEIAPESIQCIPLQIKDGKDQEEFKILNILTKIECVDFNQTIVERFTEKHGIPDKIGQIKHLSNVKILTNKVEGKHIFRLAEWHPIIVISKFLKEKLEDQSVIGLQFTPAK